MSKVRIHHAQQGVTIERDASGVPHIRADHWDDALWGLGYMQGLDRATQLLFSRVVAEGRAAERIANRPDLLETDAFFRRVGLHLRVEDEVAALDEATRRQIDRFCDGVNAGVEATGRSLPMWATGFHPRPWDALAVLIVGKLLSFGGLAVSQMQNERLLIDLIHAGADERALRELFYPRLEGVDFRLLRNVRMANQLSDSALDVLTDLPRLAGSNAWAVSPARSATGHALLAADPHLEINRLPPIWYESVMAVGDRFAMGASLPGCPLLAVARTEKLAWGVTYMKGDTIDYFIEDCRPGGQSGWQYRRGHRWIDFRRRDEVIQRKGETPQTMSVYENDQGTLDQTPEQDEPGLFLSFRWTGSDGGGERAMGIWLQMLAAENVAQAMEIVRDCPQPTLTFVLADTDGHIGLQACGRFPKRGAKDQGLVPVPAWDAANHWQGYLSSSLLPRLYDPPEGFVATANEVQNPLNGPLLVTQLLPDYRKRRIDQRLGELPRASCEDMRRLQYDLVSVQARDLLEVFLPYMPDGEHRQRLESWDCRYNIESEEATLFQRLYVNVIMEMIGQENVIGWRRALYICTRAGYSTMVLAAIDRLLKRKKARWWELHDKREIVRRAAERLDGFQPVPWGEKNSFQFVNRFFSGGGSIGRLLGFKTKRIPMPGCHATPFQGHVFRTANHEQTFAPSYHMVTDMGVRQAWTNLPGGPSESPFSYYYQTDIPLWLNGEYKCLEP